MLHLGANSGKIVWRERCWLKVAVLWGGADNAARRPWESICMASGAGHHQTRLKNSQPPFLRSRPHYYGRISLLFLSPSFSSPVAPIWLAVPLRAFIPLWSHQVLISVTVGRGVWGDLPCFHHGHPRAPIPGLLSSPKWVLFWGGYLPTTSPSLFHPLANGCTFLVSGCRSVARCGRMYEASQSAPSCGEVEMSQCLTNGAHLTKPPEQLLFTVDICDHEYLTPSRLDTRMDVFITLFWDGITDILRLTVQSIRSQGFLMTYLHQNYIDHRLTKPGTCRPQ